MRGARLTGSTAADQEKKFPRLEALCKLYRRCQSANGEPGQSGTWQVMLWLGGPALIGLIVYTLPSSGKVLALGLLTAVAAFAVGAIIGFLFGIPRSIAATSHTTGQGTANGEKGAAAETELAQHFKPNSNLEEISDWLTKILVGVGLVQIHQVSSAIESIANGLAPGLGGGDYGYPVAVTLLIAFSITGFLCAYLYTRLHLQNAFELASVIKRAIKERADTETTAIALVQQQLTPGTDKPTLDALTEALEAATPGIRTQAFFLARKQRFEYLSPESSTDEKKEFAGLSISVFKALIACDADGLYHRSRAELGYTLLEQEPPEFAAAKAAFDEAIRLRSSDLVSRTPFYEFNRAYCTIELDPDWGVQKVSRDPVIDSICSDLEAVVDALERVDRKKREIIMKWLKLNSVEGTPSYSRAHTLLAGFDQVTIA
jgi:hypothetical protein